MSDSLGSMLSATAFAMRSTFGTSVSVSSLSTFFARRDMYCCWLEMRARSLSSPTPCLVRMNCSASTPDTVRMPAGQSMPVCRSRMPSPAMHTSTPPIASVTAITPSKLMAAANSIGMSPSVLTVFATHESPACSNREFMRAFCMADATEPSGRVHSGTSTPRSRGSETTVTLRGSAETCTRRVTSLRRSPSASSHRSANSAVARSPHSSVPAIRMLKDLSAG